MLLWFIQIQHSPKRMYFVSKMFVTVSQLRTRCSLPYTIFPVTSILQVKGTLCSNLLKQSTFPSIPFMYYTQTLVARPPPAQTTGFPGPNCFASTHNFCCQTPIALLIREDTDNIRCHPLMRRSVDHGSEFNKSMLIRGNAATCASIH